MNNSDHLFELIQSMTQAEKRHFRLEVSKYAPSEGHDYLQIYDWMEKQENYDEELLKKSLKDSKLARRISNAKNYLYNLLLKTLTIYHAEENSFARISWLLQQVQVLYSKGLYKSAKKLLEKAKKTAQHYEQPLFLMQIYHWEYLFAELIEQVNKSEIAMQKIKTEEKETWDELTLRRQLEQLHTQAAHTMLKSGMPRNEEERSVYEAFKQVPILSASEQSRLRYNQSLRYGILGLCDYMLLNRSKSLEYSAKRIELYEQAPHLLQEDNQDYTVSVFNIVQVFYLEKKYELALLHIQKAFDTLTQIKAQQNKRSQEFLFLLRAYHSPRIWMAQGKFEMAAALSLELKEEYLRWGQSLNRHRLFFLVPICFASCHFVLQNYDEALFWLRWILNNAPKTARFDILGMARIIHLFIQYELGNTYVLEYYLDSTQRYIEDHKNLHSFEKLMLRFLRQIMNIPKNSRRYPQVLRQTKQRLEQFLLKDSFEKRCIEQYHLISWIESKLQKRALLDIVLETSESE